MAYKCESSTLRSTLLTTVARAGEYARTIRATNGRNLAVSQKSPKDLVTAVDTANERRIKAPLRRIDPKIGFWGEETGRDVGSSAVIAIVDPLDATTNYVLGLPFYSVMGALVESGVLTFGVISVPEFNEVYSTSEGYGAFLNGRPIRVSKVSDLSNAVISCNRSNYPDDLMPKGLEIIQRLMRSALSWRNFGTAGVEYAMVASGRLDGIITPLAEPVHAAGYILMKEAGAVVTDHLGNPISLDSKTVVAANPKLHEQLIEMVKGIEF